MKKEKINSKEIARLSGLSALEFSEKDREILIGEVSGIIEMLNQCNDVDSKGFSANNIVGLDELREDVVTPSMNLEDVFMNAPRTEDRYFVSEKVVD